MTKVQATGEFKSVGLPHPGDLPEGEARIVFDENGEADVTDEQLAALKEAFPTQFIYPDDPDDSADSEDAEARATEAKEQAEEASFAQAVKTEQAAIDASAPPEIPEEAEPEADGNGAKKPPAKKAPAKPKEPSDNS